MQHKSAYRVCLAKPEGFVRLTRTLSVPKFNRNIWMLSVAVSLASVSFMGMVQLLKTLYLLRLGRDPELIGAVFASGAVGFALTSLLFGALGTRWGSRRLMIGGMIINVLGVLLLPVTELMPEEAQVLWPFVSDIIASSGWALVIVGQIPALVSFTTVENRSGAYGLKEGLVGLGQFLGALIGGALPAAYAGLLQLTTDQPAPYRYALCTAALVGLIGLGPLMRVGSGHSRKQPPGSSAVPLPVRPLVVLVAVAFLSNTAVASCRVFYSAYLDQESGLTTSLIGAIASTGMLLAVVGSLSSARLARRRGSGRMMVFASLGMAGSLLLMGVLERGAAVGMGTIAVLALAGVWMPSFQVYQMGMVNLEGRSVVAGVCSTAVSFGFASMSFVGGRIVAGWGYRWLFLLGAICAILSATLAWRMSELQARDRRHHAAGPARAAPCSRDH
jgi:predicted MFS family arabinose efflux permease